MKNKSLDEIRPARGVKTTRKTATPAPAGPTRIIKDVLPPRQDIPPPSEDAAKIVIENNRAKEKLIEAIKGINRLMNYQVLPENRSMKDDEEERSIVSNLVSAAIAMEALSPGEGLLGMAVLAVRQGLSLRDAGNRLAYEIDQLRRELKTLRELVEKHD